MQTAEWEVQTDLWLDAAELFTSALGDVALEEAAEHVLTGDFASPDAQTFNQDDSRVIDDVYNHPKEEHSRAPSLDTELQHLVHAPYDTPVLEALTAFAPATQPAHASSQDLHHVDKKHAVEEEEQPVNRRVVQHAPHVVDGVANLRLPDDIAPAGAGSTAVTPHTPVRRVDGVARRPIKPRHVLLWDKFAFVLGSSCLWVCAFWMGRSPSSLYRLYTALGTALFLARYAVYRARKWHYYLLDMCYACNALLLVHLWLYPKSKLLARATYAFNTGPLTTSILAFRNSLVYHDMDKVTSLFLHLVPACVSWTQHWYADQRTFGTPMKGDATWTELLFIPLAMYLVWATIYFLTIFVWAADRIRTRGYTTLFTYVTSQKRGTFAAIARRVPKALQPPVYLALHGLFCAVSMVIAACAWSSFAMHTAWLVAAASLSIYHGSCYYFEVFARKYHSEVIGAPLATPNPPATPTVNYESAASTPRHKKD